MSKTYEHDNDHIDITDDELYDIWLMSLPTDQEIVQVIKELVGIDE